VTAFPAKNVKITGMRIALQPLLDRFNDCSFADPS
jgi:hypothetical protein